MRSSGTASGASTRASPTASSTTRSLAAFQHGLTPILCIGENLAIRREGRAVPFVLEQLRAGLFDVKREFLPQIVIAYEPIWAIGTGEVATPDDAQQVCKAIRYFVADISSDAVADQTRVIYGGSVKARNIASLMAQDDIDGALVGGASIEPEEFSTICRFRDQRRPEQVTGSRSAGLS